MESKVNDLIIHSEKLIEENKIFEAREILIQVLTDYDGENIDAANNYAVTEILLGNYQSAEDLLLQILLKEPQNETAKENLSFIKIENHDKCSVQSIQNSDKGTLSNNNKTGNDNPGEYINDSYKKYFLNNQPIIDGFVDFRDYLKLELVHLKRISFEISNICNLSGAHKKCPINQFKEKVFLSSEVIERTIDELSVFNYCGTISFHIYNEPLMDPRLFYLIQYAKSMCPRSTIYILTNGQNLTQTIVNELQNRGVGLLVVSAYSVREFDKIKNLEVKIPFKVFKATLDSRMEMYESNLLDLKKECLPFLRDLSINCFGDLIICCLDWKRKHIFGNLYKESLIEIFNKQEVQKVHSELLNGTRNLHLCRRCDWTR